jgi:hypothetical protein
MHQRLYLFQPHFLHQYLVPHCRHSLVYSLNSLRDLYCWYEKHIWRVYGYICAKPQCRRQTPSILLREGKGSGQRARTYPYVSVRFSRKSIRRQAISCRALKRNMLHVLIAAIKYSPAC